MTPIPRKVSAVTTELAKNHSSLLTSMSGASGTRPATRNARKVVHAARAGSGVSSWSPSSSVTMVSTQRLRSSVMTRTTSSSTLPSKPLERKISRISSRSPSGISSMCASSIRRARSTTERSDFALR